MTIELRFFATFREAVGAKTTVRAATPDLVVGDVVHELVAEHEGLDLLENGELAPYVNVLVNGRNVVHLDGLDTPLEEGDTVSLFPPVEGGTRHEPVAP